MVSTQALGCIQLLTEKVPDLSVVSVDVGAANRKSVVPPEYRKHIKLLAFEPDSESWAPEEGAYGSETWSSIALSNKNAEKKFYITKKRECSSFLKPNHSLLRSFDNPSRFNVVDTKFIETRALDHALESLDTEQVDSLKIDVQGLTSEVLEGAQNTLNSVKCIVFESEVIPLYRKQRLIGDVLQFLAKTGFHVIDMRPIYWMRRGLHIADQQHGQLIFLNGLAICGAERIQEMNQSELARLAFILLCYDFVDLALSIVRRFGKESTMAEDLRGLVRLDKMSPWRKSVQGWHSI